MSKHVPRTAFKAKYPNLFTRLVANTDLSVPDNPNSCWIYRDTNKRGYPRITIRIGGKLVTRVATRVILEEILEVVFPFDEAGHLCYNQSCINPDHLEVQTPAFNKSERRGYTFGTGKSYIPVLFPREDPLQLIADKAYSEKGEIGLECPF